MTDGTTTPEASQEAKNRLTDGEKGQFRTESVTDSTLDSILSHAREDYERKPPVECCGFIVTDGKKQKAVRSLNKSANPEHAFRTCPVAWRDTENSGLKIVAVYHSHINQSPAPSPGDKAWSEKAKLPFLIVGMPTGALGFYEPTGWRAALEGRTFVFGILDCFTLIQDYFAEKLQIEILDFEYEDEWWKPKDGQPAQDLYVKHFAEAGFIEVSPPLRKHDVLLIQIPNPYSTVCNHAAIYLGDGQILHHLQDRLSKRDNYMDGYGYARMVRKVVRHRSLC